MSGAEVVFDQSDLPTFRKMAAVYTRLAAEDGDAGAKMVHRIVAEVTTRLVAAMPVPPASPGKEPPMSAAEALAQHQISQWAQHDGWWGCTCDGDVRCDAQHQVDALKAAGYLLIPRPSVSPFGTLVSSAKEVQEVWDAFVAPSQSDDAPPQSAEMRVLMAILRAVHSGLDAGTAGADR